MSDVQAIVECILLYFWIIRELFSSIIGSIFPSLNDDTVRLWGNVMFIALVNSQFLL